MPNTAPSTSPDQDFYFREIGPLDAAFIQKLTNTPGWLQHIGDRGTRTIEGSLAYIERAYTEPYARVGFGLWAVVNRSSQQPMGVCGLVSRPDAPAPDLGFALLPEFEGRGWIRSASRIVLSHAWEHLHLTLVDAYANEDNARSRKTLEALGFACLSCAEHPLFRAVVCHYRLTFPN
ncbi:MAG: GNAT family N-acetyltransferase [Bacteroidetes bacterium]|nr:GNAT family N-acetyltransferase [Bacteroidota bacterium]